MAEIHTLQLVKSLVLKQYTTRKDNPMKYATFWLKLWGIKLKNMIGWYKQALSKFFHE